MIYTCKECGGEMKSLFDGTLIECSVCHRVEKTLGSEEKRTSKCRACGYKIVFVPTKTGKLIPVNADTYDNSRLFDIKKHISHFATCPKANNFRKDKRP
jgi:DNA-directed RNA polymerase subunit RPC12/RpoP